MVTFSTIGGWAAVIAMVGGYYYFQLNQSKKRRTQPVKAAPKRAAKAAPRPPESRNQETRKAKKDGSFSGGEQEGAKSQKKKMQALKAEQVVETASRAQVPESGKDDETDNKEFARQLASLKTGTIMAPKSQAATKQKSVKQSRAQEKLPVETSSDNATSPSSVTGGDADDDQSSLNSPELSAITTSPAQNGDVSDMLEAPAAGPSVLKITESTTPSRPKKAKQAPAFEAVETKKQRQNRKKNEAKKAAREEEEKERQKAMENQRRTARIAEGRSAKDGSTFMASKTPSQSAWAAPSGNGASGNQASGNNVQLLDTYESSTQSSTAPPLEKKVTTVPAEALYSEGEMAGSDWQNNFSSLPSEEEQTRLAMEESDSWNTVKTKERRKRDKAAPKEGKGSSSDERTTSSVPPVNPSSVPAKKSVTTTTRTEPTPLVVEQEKEDQDSEWEVA